MSRVNEAFSPLGRGVQKGYGTTSTPGGLEPTTPQAPTTRVSELETPIERPAAQSATAGIPGAVPYSARAPTRDADPIKPSTKLQEDPSYHQPYSRDIHHGEHMFPGVRGHETEEFEKIEGYASPDDVSPEIKERVEKYHGSEGEQHTHQSSSQTSSQQTGMTGAGQQQGIRSSASDLVRQASDKAAEARQYAGTAAERTKEAARQAVGVARVQLHRAVVVGKEKVGVPAEKPLVQAAKEKMGIAPDQPVGEAARQVTRQTIYAAKDTFYNFTAWLINFLATLPTQIREMHAHGKRLAEEKDHAYLAQQAQQGQPQPHIRRSVPEFEQHGPPLPMPREYVDQSDAGIVKGTHVEGAYGTQGHQGAAVGSPRGERRGGGLSEEEYEHVSAVPQEQGTSLQSRVKAEIVVDESGMHSLK